MKPRVVNRSAFTVVGLKYHGSAENKEIPQLWVALEPRISEIQNKVDQHTSYGISANVNLETGTFDYIAGFEVSSAEDVPQGMVRFEVPAGQYAVFATTLSTIGETFDYAYQIWLPQSDFQHTTRPDFEVYGEAFDPRDPHAAFDLYVAVRQNEKPD